jgi:hypothetical protein
MASTDFHFKSVAQIAIGWHVNMRRNLIRTRDLKHHPQGDLLEVIDQELACTKSASTGESCSTDLTPAVLILY